MSRDNIEISTQDLASTYGCEVYSYFFFDILVCFIWCRPVLGDYLWAVLLRIPVINYFPEFFFDIMIILAVLCGVACIYRRIELKDIGLYILLVTIYVANWSLSTDNAETIEYYAFTFLCLCLPMYFIGLNMDFVRIKRILFMLSVISIFAMALYKYFFSSGYLEKNGITEDMFAAYNILPHALLVLLMAMEKPKLIRVVVALFGGFFVFSFGTRGPMVCVVAFVILYLSFFKKWKRPWIIRITLIGGIILLLAFSEPIIMFLQTITAQIGMSTRIYTRLLDGTFLDSWGRSDINELIFPAINNSPWVGYGIAGDRIILNDYSHNILIEFIASFGIPIGVLLFILVVVLIGKGLTKSNSADERSFVLLLTCSSFFKLMLSGTYLSERNLFLLLGICIGIIRRKKRIDSFDI